MKVSRSITTVWIATGLLLLIFLVRLPALETFPLFIDETVHLHTAERVVNQVSPLFQVWLGRQFTIWWYALFAAPFAAPAWVARMTTLLVILLGAAALLALARRFGGRWGMIIAGLLYAFSPFHLFFDRLALSDNLAGGVLLLATYFASRLDRRARAIDAALTGICLFLAFGAKVSALPYFGIPIAAVVALTPRRRLLGQTLRWLGIALGIGVGLTTLYMGAVRLRGFDLLSNSLNYALNDRGNAGADVAFSPQRILENIALSFDMTAAYFTPLLLILLLLCALVLVIQRKWYLPLVVFAPILVLWASIIQESRYWVTALALLLVIGAIVVGSWLERARVPLRWAVVGAIAAWGIVAWLPMAIAAYRQPPQLPLWESDRQQYMLSDAGGFNLRGAADLVLAQGDATEIIAFAPNCQSLRFQVWDEIAVSCPVISPNPETGVAALEWLSTRTEAGLYLIVEQTFFVPQDVPGTLIGTITEPVARPPLRVYRLDTNA